MSMTLAWLQTELDSTQSYYHYNINQGCMSRSTYKLECGRNVPRLRRSRRRRRRRYVPTSNTANHDYHKEINRPFARPGHMVQN